MQQEWTISSAKKGRGSQDGETTPKLKPAPFTHATMPVKVGAGL